MAKHTTLPATLIVDAAGTILTWNAECQWLFGLTSDEAVGQPFAGFFAAGQGPAFGAQLLQGKAKAAKREAELVSRDKTRFMATLTVVGQRRDNGTGPDQYVAVVETIPPLDMNGDGALTDTVLLKRFSESLPGPFYVLDQVGHLVLWNRLLEQVTQMTADELAGAHALDFFDDREKATIKQKMRNAFELGRSSVEALVIAKDGTRTPYLFNCARTIVDEVVCICGMGIDITERKKAEEILHLHQRAIQASVNGVVIARRDGQSNRIEFVNPAFEEITGYSQEEAAGRDLLFTIAPELDVTEHRKVRDALEQSRSVQAIFRSRRKNGHLFWNDLKVAPVTNIDGVVTHVVAVVSDVTETKNYETQLEHLANRDPLTGLANRNLLHDHLQSAIQHARRLDALAAVAFIDIDNFKSINDTLGHTIGDHVLQIVANRLRSCVRDTDTVARVGGDEFVAIFANQPAVPHVVELLERMRQSVAEAVPYDGHKIYVKVSIGVSMFPDDGLDGDTLLRAADAAMYHAKFIGRNNYQFYSPDLNATVRQRLRLEADLRSAIDSQEMFLLFQPKVDLETGRIVGAEALVRWQHPAQGILSPAEFIPVAEETGLIVPMGEWILAAACAELKNLHMAGFDDFSISVNLSGRQLMQRDFVNRLTDLIRAIGLPPKSLELELTESYLMENPERAIYTLSQLRNLGVQLSIDDFGTGYSSLSYLKKFRVGAIKIDRSFVQDVCHDNEDAIITRAVIALGHNLNVKVIAEGVETKEQLAFLRRHECDQIQGYYFSHPVSAEQLRALLEAETTLQG